MIIPFEVARERAARGAALLDEKSPGWWRTMVPENIDIRYTHRCVVGTLNPDVGYISMLYKLELNPDDLDELKEHGFDLGDDECVEEESWGRESSARLTDAWRNLIAKRQLEAGLR